MQSGATDAERLKALGELVAMAAHELNNPLTSIVGLLELLAQGTDDRDAREKLQHEQSEAHRAARLVRGLLSIARARPPVLQPLDLADVTRLVCGIKRPLLERQLVGVELDAPGPVPVLGDRDQIQQALLNLVTNAEHAVAEKPPPRRVRIGARVEGSKALLEVEDSGPGVPPELRRRVFDAFYTTRKGLGGTGLGLTISRAIVEAHKGDLAVEPGELGGALFRASMPLAGNGARAPAIRALDVLAVDDDPSMRSLLDVLIRSLGHRPTLASDVKEALAALDGRACWDALLIDVRLPDGTGFDVLARAVRVDPTAAHRAIFITADELSPEHRERLIDSGAHLLLKPFVPADLSRALTAIAAHAPAEALV